MCGFPTIGGYWRCANKSTIWFKIAGWQRGCWWLHAIFCQLVAMAWTTERGSSFRPWLTCWWILNSHLLEEILNSHCAALEERPSRTRTKVQNMRKGLLVVSNNKEECSNMVNWPSLIRRHQLYHLQWCVTLKEISICTALWTDIYVEPFVATIEKNLQYSANTVGVKCGNSSSQICHFQNCPFTEFYQ